MIGLLYSAIRNVDVHNFQRFQKEEIEAIERMTSGKAINRASDDLASMGYLSKVKAELLGSNQAIQNSNDAFSFAEVGESVLIEYEERLHRMKELAIQSMDAANNGQDVNALIKEFNHCREVIANVIEQTEFAGTKIFNDSAKWFQTNWNPTEITTFEPVNISLNQFESNELRTDGRIANPERAAVYNALNNSVTTSDSFILKGDFEPVTISVSNEQTAYAIANIINQNTETTGIKAEAVTYAKLDNLWLDGHVHFTLHGKSSAEISAKITDKTNLEALNSAINEQSHITGISAELTDNQSAIILCNNEGYNIGIEDFGDYDAFPQSIRINGLKSDGVTTTLSTSLTVFLDSGIFGGHLILESQNDFSIVSNEGNALFEETTKQSTSYNLETATINSFDNASKTLEIIDSALNTILDKRSQFGNVMQRLKHNANSLQNTLALLDQTRSTKEDTDFAAEMVKKIRSRYMIQANKSVTSVTNKMSKNALQLI